MSLLDGRRRRVKEREHAEMEQRVRALETVVAGQGDLIAAVITGKEVEEVALSSGGLRCWRVKPETGGEMSE